MIVNNFRQQFEVALQKARTEGIGVEMWCGPRSGLWKLYSVLQLRADLQVLPNGKVIPMSSIGRRIAEAI